VDVVGNLYIADTGNYRVREVAANGIISTVAGGGSIGYSGDGGPATSAGLNYPYGVAVDVAGNLYIADFFNSRVRKVATNGTISTVAGGGGSYPGDGGPATNAVLGNVTGVAVDVAGNLYIADPDNNRIRKVAANGTISTVAGNGTLGYSGDGGPATSAQLWSPDGVAVDVAGNLYIADGNNNRIRKVATNGMISTVAGNGSLGYSGDGGPATSAQMDFPWGLAVDSVGNLYIADGNNNRIRKVATNGTISTVAGNGSYGYSGDGGPATSAELSGAYGVALDAAGNLYIADTYNCRIRKVAATSGSGQ
jgi:sugar lactone lactonase YvrE